MASARVLVRHRGDDVGADAVAPPPPPCAARPGTLLGEDGRFLVPYTTLGEWARPKKAGQQPQQCLLRSPLGIRAEFCAEHLCAIPAI